MGVELADIHRAADQRVVGEEGAGTVGHRPISSILVRVDEWMLVLL